MKKSIIAAGASAVLAAMPVVGVFATGSVEDTIKVGITETCQIALASSNGHVNGSGDNAGAWGTEATANVLAGNIANGGVAQNYGSTNMVITCNHATGYAVTAVATDLDGENTDAAIPLDSTFSAANSGWAYKVSAKAESMTTNATDWYGSAATKTNASLITGDAPINNGAFTVMYGVSVDATQEADNYSGTITYTIAAA